MKVSKDRPRDDYATDAAFHGAQQHCRVPAFIIIAWTKGVEAVETDC